MKRFAVVLMLAGCGAPAPEPTATGGNGVFVCEDDAKQTEFHVGVRRAVASYRSAGMWELTYTDGRNAVYVQRHGETCAFEVQP